MGLSNFWKNFNKLQLIAGHRGFRAIRAENTISAFLAAYNRCDLIELDVTFSKDGVPLVIHDDTLTRTTDAYSHKKFTKPYRVSDYSYEELLELDASSWFAKSDPFNTIECGFADTRELTKWNPQRIPTLQEVLELCKLLKLPVNVELKDHSKSPVNAVATLKVVKIIKDLKMEHMVLLSSFNHNYLKEAKELAPKIETAALQEGKHIENPSEYLAALGTNNYNISAELADKESMRKLLQAGINVGVYTVNSPIEKIKIFKMGAKVIYTDFLEAEL